MKKFYHTLPLILLSLLFISGCQNLAPLLETFGAVEQKQEEETVVTDLKFSDDLELITASIDQKRNFGSHHLDDTSVVKIVVRDYSGDNAQHLKRNQPEIVTVRNTERERIKDMNLNMLAVLDITQDREVLEGQRKMLEVVRHTFSEDNLFLTFMLPGGELSAIYAATPYVLSTYTSARTSPLMRGTPENPYPYLYRSLSTVIQELADRNTSTPLDSSAFTSILVFSGTEVYDKNTNMPLDPEHYEYQEYLVRAARQIPKNVEISYIGDGEEHLSDRPEGEFSDVPDINIMKLLCNSSGGCYLDGFDWQVIKTHIMERLNLDFSDFEIVMKNTDGQLYVGNLSRMEFLFYDKQDSLLTSAGREYVLGDETDPLIVGSVTAVSTIVWGVMLGALVILLAYLAFQIVIPLVRYRIFRRQYVVKYGGPNMTVNRIAVPDRCYMCKAPLVRDDEIVVKCSHVVHLECWEENDGHCPEYGNGCKDGSHFYNRRNLLDRRNASYLMKWILVELTLAVVAWLLFVTSYHYDFYVRLDILYGWMSSQDSAFELPDMSLYTLRGFFVPVLAFHLASFLTLGLSLLSVHKRVWYFRAADIAARVLAAGFVTSLLFLIFSSAIILFRMKGDLLVMVPWTLTALTVAFFSTFHTRIRFDSKSFYRSLAAGFVSTFVWEWFTNLESVSDVLYLLLAYMFFSTSVTWSVARDLPRNGRYFLHLSGPVKEMDVALYKWFAQKPDARVSIGKSVDCSIQINWDMKSNIAPVQAELRLDRGLPRLYAVDGTVTVNGKVIPFRHPVRLYHNDAFVIGLTTFRYVEI